MDKINPKKFQKKYLNVDLKVFSEYFSASGTCDEAGFIGPAARLGRSKKQLPALSASTIPSLAPFPDPK